MVRNCIGPNKICFIGKSHQKLQCIVNNSILMKGYSKGDVLGTAHSISQDIAEVYNENW